MTSPAGAASDVILDIVGGDYFERNLDALAFEGRLVQIGLMGGAKAQINLATVLQRRLTITGSTAPSAHCRREGRDREGAGGARVAAARAAAWSSL